MSMYVVTPFALKVPKKTPTPGFSKTKKNKSIDGYIPGMITKLKKHDVTYLELAANSLGGLNQNDKLFVVGHGWWKTSRLYSNNQFLHVNANAEECKASDLAQKIEAAGLRKDFLDIILLSCFGAGLMGQDVEVLKEQEMQKYTELMGSNGKGFMAKVLAKKLGLLGYNAINVTGYPSTVTISPNAELYRTETQYAVDPELYNSNIRGNAKSLARTFDQLGQEVIPAHHPFTL